MHCRNSTILALGTMLGVCLVAGMAAYAMAGMDLPGGSGMYLPGGRDERFPLSCT